MAHLKDRMPSLGLRKIQGVNPHKSHDIQQDQAQSAAPSLEQPPVPMSVWGGTDGEQPCQEGLGGAGGWEAEHDD